ncbi:uncharacterized protein EURHEDRAFT_409686 [Aspergillus ruber CBS 135680]|uniref:Cytochrome P450 n=1 Tax=Aspergillus ruber (strain CBS 135680) TaxID=1388766 RepID=A0A017SMG0_ASPRC|nr:uncharacterized protein EURHEDRAFT_409686 [Aspergillus ruber CBS 135680]EYE97465.1 hypothetical protein EURHEDRAFT_409686 [Aspergillus ruber CBS 135680]
MKQTEFLHTLDEILFANVDISSAVLSTLFSQLAANPAFQDALRAEISQWTEKITQYISKQDTLLNCAIMESMQLIPAFSFSLPDYTSVVINPKSPLLVQQSEQSFGTLLHNVTSSDIARIVPLRDA